MPAKKKAISTAAVSGAPLMDPAKQLGGAEALFAQRFAKRGQTFQVEVEEVGRHCMR